MKTMLRDYYDHLTESNVDSLISRIYGLHKVIFYRKKHKMQKKIYFCIMNNVFCTPNKIDYRYDLKGSTQGRYTKFDDSKPRDNTIALKDLDFLKSNSKFKVGGAYKQRLNEIIDLDAKFFAKVGIIDYSLLVGVHEKSTKRLPARQAKEGINLDTLSSAQSEADAPHNLAGNNSTGFRQESTNPVGYKKFYEANEGGLSSIDGKKVYYMGIIDIFTEYTAAKRAEYVVKSIQYEYGTASCVPPAQYAQRF